MSEYHVPVLLKESVDGLDIRQGGVYLDLTFGGGGHSGEILKRLDAEGCLLGFDQDEDALANVPEDDRFIFVNHNFRYLRNFMRYYGYEEADGILADLGVSSHEFDEAGRGFSFRFEAELDMRMNQRSKLTAATVLNTYDAEQLTAIFRNYGEVENARRLVDLIVKARANQEIKTSEAFYQIILPCIPKLKEKKYLAKVYQALRIEVNGELEALEEMMQQAMEVLKPGGRLVIITYHSLEDRIVKNFLKAGNAEGKLEKDLVFGHVHHNFELVNRKVIVPSEEEIVRNPRARSAKLRIARKEMGVFNRKKITEDVPVEEERQEEVKTSSSVKSVLEGSLLAEKLRQNIRFVLFATFLGIWYISNGYSTEKLHRERVLLEKEVSEIIKRIKNEGLALEESKEPPVKLYR